MYKRLPPWKRPLPLLDPANKETEQIIEELTARMRKEYRQAVKEVHAQMESYLSRFEAEDKAWKEAVENGEKTAAQYRDWRSTKMLTGKRWQETKMQMAEELHRRNVTARDYVTGKMPQVYAINHNYGTYEVESRGMIDTSYTLYDEDTVLRLMKNDPDILPPPGKRMKRRLKENPDLRWQFGQIQSVTVQSILQGESIPDVARRIARTMGERNYKDCVRYARTAMTGAENAGRYDSYRRAKKLGIDLTIEWMATLDGRTRHDHRLLDGQRREVDEPFEVDGIKILYPGQVAGESDIPQQMIWNCRCTLVSWVKGFEADVVTESPKMGGMSYEEWKGEKQENHEDSAEVKARIERIAKLKEAFAEFGGVPDSYRAELYRVLENADDDMLEIVSRTADDVSLTYYDSEGTCHKNGGSDSIVMYRDDKDEAEFARTFWHEYGHLTDNSPNGGYSYEETIKYKYGNQESRFTHAGIKSLVTRDNAYQNAAAKDINLFLERNNIADRYKASVSEWGIVTVQDTAGNYLEFETLPFEDSETLSGALSKWVRDASGKTEAYNYLVNQGYPKAPEWSDFYETYTTPKRGIVRTRPRYKGAADDYSQKQQEYFEKREEFETTHNMEELYARQKELSAAADERESILGFATDTFDEAAYGIFTAVIHGGHSADYYRQGHGEGIANIFSALMTKDPVMNEALQDLCPNMYELIKGVILGG